ncbi:MAG: pyridoxal phosphate-dependent aminotransferase [Bacteroidia bacterium]|jgi:aspartate aminotransferase|nr:pyridoxal phosphate-dependent aminotransferase [Bacteroidia bacterium]
MNFTTRLNRIKESLTIGMAKKARELKAQGKDVISLSLGEPDFDTPQHIKDAAIHAIDSGKTKYTPVGGIPELKSAICSKFQHDYNLEVTPANVMVSTGAKQCIMNAILSLVDHGEEVIIPLPYWVSYSEMVNFAGGKSVFIPSKFEEGFAIDIEAMERSINDKTRVILFSSPNNPAGSSLSYDQLKQIADIVKKHPKITVISDEIYEHITFDGEHTTISQFDGISDQLIIVNGVSKGFAMTGWRIGYMVGPKELISACDKLQGQFTSGANSIAQWAAAEAISGDMKPTQNMLNTFRKRRDMMVELLSEIPGVETDTPKGAFYLFPKVSSFYGKEFGGRTINDSLDFCDYILNTALVSLVPGVAFGMDEHVRISYASSEEELREAMKRIKAALT